MEDVSPLVSLEDAKRQLRITQTAAADIDADVDQKLAQATSMVVRLCGALADDTWAEGTVPAAVHTAILWTLDVLYVRPDDLSGHMNRVRDFLQANGYRDPSVA